MSVAVEAGKSLTSEVVPRTCEIGLLGFGNVGQAVVDRALAALDRFEGSGVRLKFVAALIRDRYKPRTNDDVPLVESPARFFARRYDVVVEVMGGVHPAFEYVKHALEIGIPVVTANKSLMAAKGGELREISRRTGVPLCYDAAVLAGVPFIGAVARRPFIGQPRCITGILNGTSHYLATELESGRPFADALADAIALGYAEPDSAADVSGRDAAEKLTILAHLAGCQELTTAELTTLGLDALAPVDFKAAAALGGVIKPVATASFDAANPGAWVGPALVDARHVFAGSRGVHNCLEYAGEGSPVTFAGPGAGPAVTAATILDDVAEAVSGEWKAPRRARTSTRQVDLSQPPAGGWYFRVSGAGIGLEDFAEHLAIHRVPAIRLARVEGALVARTVAAPYRAALDAVAALKAIGATVSVLPVIDTTSPGGNDVRN